MSVFLLKGIMNPISGYIILDALSCVIAEFQ